jgi:hemerythrin superfamily protein
MAKAKSKGKAKRARTGARQARGGKDAIALLKADHRQVEQWFSQFEKARDDQRKLELATSICNALKVHISIEEEIFYPAFFDATEDREIHHEAIVEHDGAKKLIAEIEAAGPEDDFYDAKVSVLSEMIKHHVKEEEGPGGMFAEARKSDMDLAELGQQLAARKAELEGEMGAAAPMPGARKSRNGGSRGIESRH